MKKINSKVKAAAYGLGAIALGMLPMVAGAVGIGSVASTVSSNFTSIADLLSGGAYLAGAALGIQAALQFKAHNENPQQVKLSKPLTYALVAGSLLAIPSFIGTATDTMWGGSGNSTALSGGGTNFTTH